MLLGDDDEDDEDVADGASDCHGAEDHRHDVTVGDRFELRHPETAVVVGQHAAASLGGGGVGLVIRVVEK